MARQFRFECTRCGMQPGKTKEEAKRNLIVKRVEFREYGHRGGSLRARVTDWLCRECVASDPQYQLPAGTVADRMGQ